MVGNKTVLAIAMRKSAPRRSKPSMRSAKPSAIATDNTAMPERGITPGEVGPHTAGKPAEVMHAPPLR